MPQPPVKREPSPGKRQKSSVDYPLLVRKLLEASGDTTASKLATGLYSPRRSRVGLPESTGSNKSEIPTQGMPTLELRGLYLVATPIGNLGDISLRALAVLASVAVIACEDTRSSGLMLAKFGIKKPLISYHDHNADERRPEILQRLDTGAAVALISDAGMPLIADPGYKLVRDCREAGYAVTVIPGANAALAALAGSGLPAEPFYFAGFLPPKNAARQKAIVALKNIPATLIFYEAPHRLGTALVALAEVLGPSRPAAVARELTKLFEETRRGNLGELAAFYATHEPKGEIVIIVGAPDEARIAKYDLDGLLKDRLKTLSVRDAVNEISAMTGVKKNEVYARALKVRTI